MEDKDSYYELKTNKCNSLNIPSNKNVPIDHNRSTSNQILVNENINPSQSKNNVGVEAPQKPKPEEGIMRRMFKYIKNINWCKQTYLCPINFDFHGKLKKKNI